MRNPVPWVLILWAGSVAAEPPDTLWTKTLGTKFYDWGCAVHETGDHGFILAGVVFSSSTSSQNLYLVRTDVNGTWLWERSYGGVTYDGAADLEPTPDGGYMVAGATASIGSGLTDMYLVRTDALGAKLWQKTFGGLENDEAAEIVATRDLCYVLVGTTHSFGAGGSDVYLVKTDALGNPLWSRTVGGPADESGWSVCETVDQGLAVAGGTSSAGAGGQDIYVVRTNSAGELRWSRTLGGPGDDCGTAIRETTSGDLVIAGWRSRLVDTAYVPRLYLARLGRTGELVWEREFGGPSDARGYALRVLPDGGCVVAGYTASLGAGCSDVFLVRTDGDGNLCWQKTIGQRSYEVALDLALTHDYGFAVAGWTSSLGAGSWDVYLVRLGPEALGVEASDPRRVPWLLVSPNPFRARTVLRWMPPDRHSPGADFTLRIYDASGRLVRRLLSASGQTCLVWDGRDDAGRALSPGIYFVTGRQGPTQWSVRLVRASTP